MSRELMKIRIGTNEELIRAVKEAMKYSNSYYNCFYLDKGEEYNEEEDIRDAKILLALQDRTINLMKRATYEELELAFPVNTDAFDDTAVYEYELSTIQNVLEYIRFREEYNSDFAVFMELRTQARITLGEF